ncbi:protein BTG3-like [Takifugu flavidus]|uniref:protein BTG3-like n=1 Tax=Takifugu flavidus TaxID=433684 RepID=UPI0025449F5B|nr:protein BTG3-like [Takifugu flavidus]
MKKEIAAAVCCLKALLAPRARLDPEKTDLFLERLSVALMEKFSGHWFPENPSRGQAYRCIRINEVQQWDPEVLRACRESRIQMSQLELPVNLTLWVDPGEVCYRIGENNPPFSFATFSNPDEETLNTSPGLDSAGPLVQLKEFQERFRVWHNVTAAPNVPTVTPSCVFTSWACSCFSSPPRHYDHFCYCHVVIIVITTLLIIVIMMLMFMVIFINF